MLNRTNQDAPQASGTSPVFIVGCSRSGTTLVQSLLASSGEIVAFPETNVLYHIADDLDYRRFGTIIGRRKIPGIMAKRFLNSVGFTLNFSWSSVLDNLPKELRTHLRAHGDGRRWLIKSVLRDFETMMTSASSGAKWVEKTPQNIFVLEFIERHFPNAQFIHVLRDPVANIASLMDAAKQYDAFRSRFGGRYGLEKAIIYCRNARNISLSRPASEKHLHLEYEKLTRNPDKTLRQIEGFLGLQTKTLKPIYDTQRITTAAEVWKQYGPEISPAHSRAKEVLSQEAIDKIRQSVR